MRGKITADQLAHRAFVYVRQSTAMQVHEHVESKQRQYALVERAVSLGWPRGNVEVIDEDQGKSGSTSTGRTGFARLADAVGHGEAGAILALEVSRLARSSADWQRLLSLCAVADVAVVDEQSVYDAADRDDKLLLDLKGTMSEAELHWLRLRLVGGRMNKARRGELELTPPVGYVWGGTGFRLDPDESVQRAVRLVFQRFAVEPSAWAVVRWGKKIGFRFPTRRVDRDGTSELTWAPLTQGRLNGVLHNPVYAGLYVYGRRPTRNVLAEGQVRRKRSPGYDPTQWAVKLDGRHPGYIDWETYVANQEKLRRNRSRNGSWGAPQNGGALLAGLLLCGRCGQRMRTHYVEARKRWSYVCDGERDTAGKQCWYVPGAALDRAVEQLFLDTVAPTELDLSLAVEREASGQAESLEKQWSVRLEQVAYEARRAERRYKAVDPDNRVVARTLEREWEERLRDLEEAQRQYADAKRAKRVELSTADHAKLRALARDLPRVWRAPSTTPAERKAMLRLVVEVITASPVEIPRRTTLLRVQWRSGAVTEIHVDRPYKHRSVDHDAVLKRVRTLAAESLRDDEIAGRLNGEQLRRENGAPWTDRSVSRLRRKAGIARLAPALPRHRPLPDRHPETGYYSVPGAARRFGVPTGVIRRWIDRGFVRMVHAQYDRYNARWLDIDDRTAAKLDRLVAECRRE